MYSTKWLVIFILLAVIHGYRSFNTALVRSFGVARQNKHFRCIREGNKFSKLLARKVNDLDNFPDAEKISAREVLKDDHLPQFTVFDEYGVGNNPSVKEGIWKRWQERHVAEDSLQLAIRSNLSEESLLPMFDASKAYLVHDKVAVLNANERFFFACCLGDMVALQALWAPSPDIVSMTNLYHVAHLEGSNIIGGYQNVLNYYARTTPTFKDYELADINLKFYGDVAVVTCKVRYFDQPRSVTAREPFQVHYVTNVFVKERDGDRYQLQSHMASPCALTSSLRAQSKIPEKSTYKDPFRKVKPRVPTMEEELSNLFNALKTGSKPSSRSNDIDGSGGGDLSSSKVIVNDLTGEEFASSSSSSSSSNSGDSAGDSTATIRSSDDTKPYSTNKHTTTGMNAASGGTAARVITPAPVYTPDHINKMEFKEIEERYRLLTYQDEVLKSLGLRTAEGVKESIIDGAVEGGEGESSELFGEAPHGQRSNIQSESDHAKSIEDNMRSLFDDTSLAEPADLLRKELASRTLSLLVHVHATNAISEVTLNTLCSDIVQSLRDSECSEVELAYSLLILGGDSEPLEALQKADPHMNSDGGPSFEKVPPEDIAEFVAFCNRSVRLRAP